jgi:SOS-response transcriptional repressor LexA
MNKESIADEIIKEWAKKTDKEMFNFFEPYLRKAGVKGELTYRKIKWRGIKMHQTNEYLKTTYQLFQRGIAISPIFEINYDLNLSLSYE